jgi:hypothetical protein
LIGATYVRNRSSNQLLSYKVPSTTGFTSIAENLPALVQNTSLELTITSVNVRTKDFLWTVGANLTIPHNKLVSFPGIENTGYANGFSGLIVGEPLGITKVYRYAGVDPATGKYQAFDQNGNMTLSPSSVDQTALISSLKKFYGGLQSSINYKGIQLDLNFQFVRQLGPRDMYFYNGYQTSTVPGSFTTSGNANQPISLLNRWQKPGDSEIGKYATGSSTTKILLAPIVSSDAFYNYDASFIRLRNLSLSWQLPSIWMHQVRLQNAKIYLQGKNLATFTKYLGLDPELMSNSTLPPLRTIIFGIQIGL